MGNWIKVKISDIGEVVGGATPSTKNEQFYNGDISWITPKDLSDFKGRFISHGERNITQQGLESCSTRLLPKNTILFSSRAPIGYVAIAKKNMCTNQGFKSVIPNEKIDYMFLYYLLKYNKDRIEAMGSGTTFKEVSGSTMRNIEVEIPRSITEQIKIANILDAIDSKIENNQKINSNLEQQAQAIFKSWFVDYEPFGGVMPSDWQVSTLGEISDMSAGGDKPDIASDIETENCRVPIYSNGITDEGLYGYTDKARIFDESVTVSARGTIGYVCLRQVPYVPIVRLVSLTPKKKLVSAKYLYLFLKQLHIAGTGTTQQQLTVPNFKGTEILIPTSEIMSKFTDIVTPFYDKILDNKVEIKKLYSLRDTLLPKLMSGDIDLSNIDI